MTEYTTKAKLKGFKMFELAERWSITPRQMSNIAKAPKQIHWDALSGIPDLSTTGEDNNKIRGVGDNWRL